MNKSDAEIELQQRVERHIRETGRNAREEAKQAVLSLDPVLARKIEQQEKMQR